MQLSPAQGGELLDLARTAIAVHHQTNEKPELETSDPLLTWRAGAFVTLWRPVPLGETPREYVPGAPGILRGCIGRSAADRELYRVVQEVAVDAATLDYRFPPLTPIELEEIKIEISVLSPWKRIEELDQIRLGQDGLIVIGENRRALLLPEVPRKYGWDREQFAQQLCEKAGLPTNYWRDEEASLFTFTTISFIDPD